MHELFGDLHSVAAKNRRNQQSTVMFGSSSSSSAIEQLAKALGLFAAYFAVYESFVGYMQPYGAETLEREMGPFYNWFVQENHLAAYAPSDWLSSTAAQAQLVSILEFAAALPVILASRGTAIHLGGLCLLSWYYMSAVRGHVALQTSYVPVAMTMFGFSHVALLTHLLGIMVPSTAASTARGEESHSGEIKDQETSTGNEKLLEKPAVVLEKSPNNRKKNKRRK